MNSQNYMFEPEHLLTPFAEWVSYKWSRQEAAMVKKKDRITATNPFQIFSFLYNFSLILGIAGDLSFHFLADLA